jgi:L-alanine-DL-glutamate epimerase-like enolase superfamily enzyme
MGLGLTEMLLGSDPLDPEALWARLYSGSKMTGRRGAVICAMGAIDMALWDIRGQATGQPIHRLLNPASNRPVTPYASLLPTGDTVAEQRASLLEKCRRVQQLGFRAAKLEVCINGPYSHNNLQADDAEGVEIVAACREAVGRDFTLMLDVAYAWPSAEHALRVLEQLAPYSLYFVETPIDVDDLAGYARLHAESPIPIAAGEWQNTHWEFLDLADRGRLDVLQPDVGRVGGFSEARRVCAIASARGLRVVPHCWKSAIGIAASVHLAAATDVCPFVEYLPAELSESPLRRELVLDELPVADGLIRPPEKPGLGIALNREAVARFSVA